MQNCLIYFGNQRPHFATQWNGVFVRRVCVGYVIYSDWTACLDVAYTYWVRWQYHIIILETQRKKPQQKKKELFNCFCRLRNTNTPTKSLVVTVMRIIIKLPCAQEHKIHTRNSIPNTFRGLQFPSASISKSNRMIFAPLSDAVARTRTSCALLRLW